MTTSAVVYAWLFIHIGVILTVTAYFTCGAAIAPRLTERGRAQFARRPWLPVLIGLALSVPWVAAALIALNLESSVVKFLGAVAGGLWVLGGLVGAAGIAQHVGAAGRRVEDGAAGWPITMRGGLLLTLTWILPLIGWLVMLPLTLCAGIGCLVLGAFARSGSSATVTIA